MALIKYSETSVRHTNASQNLEFLNYILQIIVIGVVDPLENL